MTLYARLRHFLQHINILAQEYWHAWETDEFPQHEGVDPFDPPLQYPYRLYCGTPAGEVPISKHAHMDEALFSRDFYLNREVYVNHWEAYPNAHEWIVKEDVDPFGVLLYNDGNVMSLTIVGGTDGADVRSLARKAQDWPTRQKPKDQELGF